MYFTISLLCIITTVITTTATPSLVTWGSSTYGGNSSYVPVSLTSLGTIYSTSGAFAAVMGDGSVIAWGNPKYGGDTTSVAEQLRNVVRIHSTLYAFAAIRNDAAVVTWGSSTSGGDSTSVSDQLINVAHIYSNSRAFAALTESGSVVTWGDGKHGGNSSSVDALLYGIVSIYSTLRGFAAVRKEDGIVISWGYDVSGSVNTLPNATAVYSTHYAFAAITEDRTVVSWGSSKMGGNSSSVRRQLSNVENIYATCCAFAAVLEEGAVITWGRATQGGDSSSVAAYLTDVVVIRPAVYAFAALKEDGSVITWGLSSRGGDSSAVSDQLVGIKSIFSNLYAYAAIKDDGGVVTWGYQSDGGNSTYVSDQLYDVLNIFSSYSAFAALRKDGRVITWGRSDYGGDSSSGSGWLVNVREIYGTARAFAAVIDTDKRPDQSIAYWCCKKFIQNPHQEPLHYSCVELQQDWNENIAIEICSSKDMGLTDKSANAKVCSDLDDNQHRLNLSLANQMFSSCKSRCVYDIYSDAYEAFIWIRLDQCWSLVNGGYCIGWNHPEQQQMIGYVENSLCDIGIIPMEPSASPACLLDQDWSENLMDDYCTVDETGKTYKHYASVGRAAVPCSGEEDKEDDLRKSLAMKMFGSCASWCVYDYVSKATLAWRWKDHNRCWTQTSSGRCHFDYHNGLTHSEWNYAKDSVEAVCNN